MSPLEPDVVTAPTEGAAEPFRDRSTGLVAGGVLVILLGIGSSAWRWRAREATPWPAR
jgi:hypothetical protein